MAHEERVDTIPKLKEAIQILFAKTQGQPEVAVLVESSRQFASRLNLNVRGEDIFAFYEHLEKLVGVALKMRGVSMTQKTGAFDSLSGRQDGLMPFMKELLDKVNASLPNSFISDEEESRVAAQETIANLNLIAKTASLQGNTNAVHLAGVMVRVMQRHFAADAFEAQWLDRNTLVKPLLRGFALLRAAFEAPDEPNLQAALLDATADLQQNILDGLDEIEWEGGHAQGSLNEATVANEVAYVPNLDTFSGVDEMEGNNMRQTIAFSAIAPIVSPISEPNFDDLDLELEEDVDLDLISDLEVEVEEEELPLLVKPKSKS